MVAENGEKILLVGGCVWWSTVRPIGGGLFHLHAPLRKRAQERGGWILAGVREDG